MLRGWVDVLNETEISGWAVEDSDLTRQVSVEICANSIVVAVLRCSMFRGDLLRAGLGDGRKAFHFSPMKYLSAGTNAIEIRHAGTGLRLQGGWGPLGGASDTDDPNPRDGVNHLLEVSQERWKGSELDENLTWGKILSGDSFVDALQSRVKFDGTQHILEIGPGYGRLLMSILGKRLPFRKYTGVELSRVRARALQAKFAMESIEFIHGDVNTVRLAEEADLVICSATFEHLFPDFTTALKNLMAHSLKADAKLAIDFIRGDEAMACQSQVFEADGNAFVRVYSAAELRRLYADSAIPFIELMPIILGEGVAGDVRRIFVFAQVATAPLSPRG